MQEILKMLKAMREAAPEVTAALLEEIVQRGIIMASINLAIALVLALVTFTALRGAADDAQDEDTRVALVVLAVVMTITAVVFLSIGLCYLSEACSPGMTLLQEVK